MLLNLVRLIDLIFYTLDINGCASRPGGRRCAVDAMLATPRRSLTAEGMARGTLFSFLPARSSWLQPESLLKCNKVEGRVCPAVWNPRAGLRSGPGGSTQAAHVAAK